MRLLAVLILSNLLVGCQYASNYLHSTIKPSSEFIKMSKLGLDYFHQSKYKKSQKYFQDAINIYQISENKPLISLSNIAILNYKIKGYDKVLLHNYNALNYLLIGDIENAKVETKNSNFIQRQQRQIFYSEIEQYKKIEDRYGNILDIYEQYFKNVNSTHNPYQNPFAYYVSALLYEEYEEYDDAIISINHALKFYNDSKILKEKLKLYKSTKQSQLSKRVELFFDVGQSPIKKQINIAVKIDNDKKEQLYLPTFKINKSIIDKIIVTDSNEKIIAHSSILSDIDAIKVNEFKSKLPTMISKSITESSKELISETLKNSSITKALYEALRTVYSQNNLLTWDNLPKRIEVISFTPIKDENYRLKVIDKNGKILKDISLSLNCSKKQKNCYQYYYIKEK